MAATGTGFNPYRKANGEFASPNEVNEQFEKQIVALKEVGSNVAAENVQREYDDYVMDNQPESDRAQELFRQYYPIRPNFNEKKARDSQGNTLHSKKPRNATPAERAMITGRMSPNTEQKRPQLFEILSMNSRLQANEHRRKRIVALATLRFNDAERHKAEEKKARTGEEVHRRNAEMKRKHPAPKPMVKNLPTDEEIQARAQESIKHNKAAEEFRAMQKRTSSPEYKAEQIEKRERERKETQERLERYRAEDRRKNPEKYDEYDRRMAEIKANQSEEGKSRSRRVKIR